jgi:hypothetical protein
MPFFPRSRKSGSGRRREDDGVLAVAFDLDSLEFVQASDDIGLLRVGGRWVAPVSRALGDITLVLDRDTETLEIPPLPDMNGVAPVASPAGEEWHGAFTISVEVAEDPRTEFVLRASDDAEILLPRPGEWDESDGDDPEPDPELESESRVVTELVAKLDEVARLEAESAPEQAPVAQADLAELAQVRAELDEHRTQLAGVRAELEFEKRRRESLEQELRARVSVEEDLRNAIAMQEAEMATAVAQASQRARQAERRRDVAPVPAGGDQSEHPHSHPADEEFIARLERARRASETAAG